MRAYEVRFGNNMPISAGSYADVDVTILATDLIDAMLKATDGLEFVKSGLLRLGVDKDRVETVRVVMIEEKDPVLNPEGVMDPKNIELIIASIKDDIAE